MPGLTPVKKSVLYRVTIYFFSSIAIVAADHLDGPVSIEVPVLDNNFNYWYIGIGIRYNQMLCRV